MQDEKVTDKHRKWLRERLGIEYEDIYDMDDAQIDKLSCNLMEAEADAYEIGDAEYEEFVLEVIDIIYGTYGED